MIQVRNPELVSLLKADFSPQIIELRMVARNIWRIGSKVLDLDFTGTAFDTKAKCNAYGLRFSDIDVPFPTFLVYPVSGTWGHTAGNGWAPTYAADDEGPALLLPLARASNWELDVDFNYTPTNIDQKFILRLGYLSITNHFGAYAMVRDNSGFDDRLDWVLRTNNGADIGVDQYVGAVLFGATGNYEIRFRALNDGCVGIYDDQNDTWNYYTGHQNVGHSYSADYAFVKFYFWDNKLPTLYLRNLKLSYLL